MFFKNLTIFRLKSWAFPADAEEKLTRRKLGSIGPLVTSTNGWVPSTSEGRLDRWLGDHLMLTLGTVTRILPASVVRKAVEEAAKEQAEVQGFPVGRRQLREIKEKVRDKLLANSLTAYKELRGWIDFTAGLLVVDTASAARAEEFVGVLRDTFGSFPAQHLNVRAPVHTAMAGWLLSEAPGTFSFGSELGLARSSSKIRYTGVSLDAPDIRRQLDAGMEVSYLDLSWREKVAFVLTDKLHLRKVTHLSLADDTQAEVSEEDRAAADFALMTGELSKLIAELISVLGGELA